MQLECHAYSTFFSFHFATYISLGEVELCMVDYRPITNTLLCSFELLSSWSHIPSMKPYLYLKLFLPF